MIRYEIVRGGTPSPEELAALVVALTPVAAPPGEDGGTTERSGWLRAALREGVGQRSFVSADDVDTALPGSL